MYFKEKEDTNIDSEFEVEKRFNWKSPKMLLIYGGIALVAIIIVIVLVVNSYKYHLDLNGEYTITITKNSDYVEPGYKAYNKKEDVTNKVVVTSNLDTSTIGTYQISYSYNGITKVRTVIVTEGGTSIYLKGKRNMYLQVGETYKEPGYIVYDSIEQDLTKKVKVSGNVDTSKAGTYQLTYSVTNSKGEKITTKRTIVVTNKTNQK